MFIEIFGQFFFVYNWFFYKWGMRRFIEIILVKIFIDLDFKFFNIFLWFVVVVVVGFFCKI